MTLQDFSLDNEKKRPKSESKIVKNKEYKKFEITLKEWLKCNNLAALKLTILDALGPVVVKQSASRVDILDKYVMSKVWNDVSFISIRHLFLSEIQLFFF